MEVLFSLIGLAIVVAIIAFPFVLMATLSDIKRQIEESQKLLKTQFRKLHDSLDSQKKEIEQLQFHLREQTEQPVTSEEPAPLVEPPPAKPESIVPVPPTSAPDKVDDLEEVVGRPGEHLVGESTPSEKKAKDLLASF